MLLPLSVAACASPPKNINNVCAVFDQRDSFFNNWQRHARGAEAKHGIPMPILMATIRRESGFEARARPPRRKILGFIPGKRASTAYGFSQALDGTWAQYQRETGNYRGRRNSFSDAVDFVGWYHAKTVRNHGVAPHDAFNLYLAYYSGWGGYSRGTWRNNTSLINYARSTERTAQQYAQQLRGC